VPVGKSRFFDLTPIVVNFCQDNRLSTCAIHHGTRTAKHFYQRGIAPVRPHNIQTTDFRHDGIAKHVIQGSKRGDSKRRIKSVPTIIKVPNKDCHCVASPMDSRLILADL
jgi:hypothetical protein